MQKDEFEMIFMHDLNFAIVAHDFAKLPSKLQ